jgi:ribosomal protection tetracycline resistance protein
MRSVGPTVERRAAAGTVCARASMRSLNLGILAHVDAGKTTLTERLLFEAGMLAQPGSVAAGTTQTDTMSLEQRRGITIRAAVATFFVDGTLVNLFDTPGHSDFIAEVERSLSLLDGAVLVVSAVEGVEAQTHVLMRALRRMRIATIVFVNKVDRRSADAEFVELEVRERLGGDLPVLVGSALTGAGVPALLSALPRLLPVRDLSIDGKPSGQVFKITRDAEGARNVFAFLDAGTLRVRDRLEVGDQGPHRVTGVRVFEGGELTRVTAAVAGRVVVLRGLDTARIGDRFGSGAGVPARQFSRPSLATVVEPLYERDRPALYAALEQLADQDPLIDLQVDDHRRELRLSLYGEVQQQVIGSLLAEDYGVAARFRGTQMICTEQLVGCGSAAELIGADSNPFLATVGLKVEPMPKGAGVDFALEVEPGAMPSAFFTAVETTVRDSLQHGNYGWEINDARVVLTQCGYWARQSHSHGTFDKSMSSTAGDFRGLTRQLMKRALALARTVVCEPVHRFELQVPAASLSSTLALLARQKGVPHTTEPLGSSSVLLTGHVPADRVHRLTLDLHDVARGEGVLTTRLDHYAPSRGSEPARHRT